MSSSPPLTSLYSLPYRSLPAFRAISQTGSECGGVAFDHITNPGRAEGIDLDAGTDRRRGFDYYHNAVAGSRGRDDRGALYRLRDCYRWLSLHTRPHPAAGA